MKRLCPIACAAFVSGAVGCVGQEEPIDASGEVANLTEAGARSCNSVDRFERHYSDGAELEHNDIAEQATRMWPVTDVSAFASANTNFENALYLDDSDWLVFHAGDETRKALTPWVEVTPLGSQVEGVPGSLEPLITACAYPLTPSIVLKCEVGVDVSLDDPKLGTLPGCCARDATTGIDGRALLLRMLVDQPQIDDSTDILVRIDPGSNFPDACMSYNVSWGGRTAGQ